MTHHEGVKLHTEADRGNERIGQPAIKNKRRRERTGISGENEGIQSQFPAKFLQQHYQVNLKKFLFYYNKLISFIIVSVQMVPFSIYFEYDA